MLFDELPWLPFPPLGVGLPDGCRDNCSNEHCFEKVEALFFNGLPLWELEKCGDCDAEPCAGWGYRLPSCCNN